MSHRESRRKAERKGERMGEGSERGDMLRIRKEKRKEVGWGGKREESGKSWRRENF